MVTNEQAIKELENRVKLADTIINFQGVKEYKEVLEKAIDALKKCSKNEDKADEYFERCKYLYKMCEAKYGNDRYKFELSRNVADALMQKNAEYLKNGVNINPTFYGIKVQVIDSKDTVIKLWQEVQ